MDDDAEEYIVSWARELPLDVPFRVVIHLPENEALKAHEHGLATEFSNYFAERAVMLERDLKEIFRNGWRYLSIGVPVLILCLVASQIARTIFDGGPLARRGESLIIVGWVANWKPIETFLYDWWPLQRDLYRGLANAVVEISVR